MPLSRNPLFVGRQEDLIQLARTLKGGETLAIGQLETTAATGLGGLGKTQLACEFVHRYGQYFAGGVFWLSLADPKAVPAEVAACGGAGALELRSDFGNLPLEEQVRLVLAAWQSPLPRLLVFDNCEDPTLLAQWQPASGGCRILITSRRADWPPAMGVTPVPLDVLNRPESIALLRKHYPDADDAILDTIAAELGDLPLALHLAGCYLARYRRTITPVQYLAQLRDSALLQHPSFRGNSLSPTRHVPDVYRTIALSYDQLDPIDPVDNWALLILARAACLAPGEPIPYSLLTLTLQLPEGDLSAGLQAEDGINRLVELGLVRSEADNAMRLHRLVVAFVQDATAGSMEALREVVEQVVVKEAARLNQAGYPAALLAWQSHLRAVTEIARSRSDEQGARLCDVLGEHLWRIGDYTGARPYWEQTLAIRQKVLGEEHPDTATSLNTLGFLLESLEERTAARPYYERALAIRQKLFGEDHLDTAESLNNVGYSRQVQGDLVGARPYHERALAVRQKLLGEEHPLIAISLSNLAYLHYAQGDLNQARSHLDRALAMQEKILGAEHPDTVFILSNLGELLHTQGDLGGAQSIFEQVVTIRRKVLGEAHPDTAKSLNYLGSVRRDQGDLLGAQQCYEQSLAIYEACFGPDHPKTRLVQANLAHLNAALVEKMPL
jgi:tetratricopeptide (TPR) repeat protein